LVWTRIYPVVLPLMDPSFQEHSSITFDADRGFPGPGFRLGFPSIQGPFENDQANGSASYLMIMPSGAHVELREAGSTNTYESIDGSHLQLIDGGDYGELLVQGMDGTQMTYLAINSEYRCTGIKDRNGNLLTVKYDSINGGANFGRMTSVIDTLGRAINFTYDANYRLQSITQSWEGTTHIWATFGYTDINVQTNFQDELGAALVMQGLPSNNTVSVLSRVGLDDGSRYDFDYTSWGQIWAINHFASDGTRLAYTRYNLPATNSTPQTDCPRFTQRLTQANDWNGNSPAATNYQFALGGVTGQLMTPDRTLYKESYATDGWQKGLTIQTDTYSSDDLNTPKKTTTTTWTQDNTGLSYPLNPRPTENIIRDSSKRRRTTLEYTSFGLLSDELEWEPNGTDAAGNEKWLIIRRAHIDYNLSDAYLGRHIIGLPQGQYLFARNVSPNYSSQVLMSKVTYEYDAVGDYLQDQGNPVQHDSTYNAGLTSRGNLTSQRQWDVSNDENNPGLSIASTSGYNTAGSAIFTRDPLWVAGQAGHQISVSYTDSGTGGGNTLAYPTTTTDGDEFSSTMQYRYDIGAVVRRQSPRPQGTTQDPVWT
jgi:YD repeat-containing protein